MVRECLKTNTRILFSDEALRQIGLYPMLYSLAAPVTIGDENMPAPQLLSAQSTDGSTQVLEEAEELQDALSNIHDQLERNWFWWILELLPFQRRYYSDKHGSWRSTISYVFEFFDARRVIRIYYFFHS